MVIVVKITVGGGGPVLCEGIKEEEVGGRWWAQGARVETGWMT